MANVFFISDLHFGHVNMAIKRGFENIEDHDNYIISQWNSIVTKRDIVWVLGDITMEKSTNYPLLDKLLGIKKVVLGNHDKPQHVPELLKYVNSVSGMVQYKGYVLTHCPIHESELGRFRANVHGHVHENSLSNSKYINVSCEAIDYKPLKLF
jgi:calcineurin-like phosphoesterase family protein